MCAYLISNSFLIYYICQFQNYVIHLHYRMYVWPDVVIQVTSDVMKMRMRFRFEHEEHKRNAQIII